MKRLLTVLLGVCLSLAALASPSYRYVDGDVASDGDGLSWATAWKNPGHVSSMNVPGRVQYIKASNYIYPNLFLQNLTGTSAEHIQFIGVPGPRGWRPYVVQSASGQTGGAYWPTNLHYVDVTNIDAYNPPSTNPNGSCFFIGSTGGAATVDHITLGLPWPDDTGVNVKGFSAIGCGALGVQAEYADYITVANGYVANNGSTVTSASPSGISLLSFCGSDNSTSYHNYILNNVVYGEASTTGSTVPSDYNGIIIDDMDNYQSAVCGHTSYPYGTLIQGNLVFGNQGKGIHVWATNADLTKGPGIVVDHNTGYLNCQLLNTPCSVNDGDFDALGASGHYTSGVTFTNNTIYAPYYAIRVQGLVPTTGVASANCNTEYGAVGSKTANWDNSGTFTNTSYIAVDPLLMAPSTAPAGADFRPSLASPQPSC